jgi:predicted ABC-type ATPase
MPPAANDTQPFIFVLAGVNGAGKSSVGGAILEEHGLTWFNPDSYARELIAQLGVSLEEANAGAWQRSRLQLEAALTQGTNYAFETTLGGKSIPALLGRAVETHRVVMIFCGLSSPEQHIERVRFRVANGGHDIPESKIRERWIGSRANLIRLLPYLARVQVLDNSAQAAPGEAIPDPVLVLETIEGSVAFPDPGDAPALARTPEWARPVLQAAIESGSKR